MSALVATLALGLQVQAPLPIRVCDVAWSTCVRFCLRGQTDAIQAFRRLVSCRDATRREV